ncbi:Kyphoscoliosis peptidase [Mizuhopecten yessoensis]|uniref:Kyphoscoliosis peptidase n=1 Tax=Mizuhopecten yessoensis TaxID=6573 RepID=A0A210QZ52_MIZYE|nr:Kyphoscoliosis peptidase [Mizuhopecten yessoensis]
MGGSPSKSSYRTQPGGWLTTRTPAETQEPPTETQGTQETAALPPRNAGSKDGKRSLYTMEPGYPTPVPPPNNLVGILSVTDVTVPNSLAKEITADSCNTMEELVEELTGDFNMDILKVRAIFMWVGTQPFTVQQYPDDADPESPTGYLRRMAMGKMSYAEIFTIMCRLAKVPCVMIPGVAKSSAYEVGDENVDKLRNVWNAVYVAGGWRIIFLLWAFRSIAGKSTGVVPIADPTSEDYKNQEKMLKEKIISTVKEYYFLTSPEEFVYRCLPDEEKWQMSYKKFNKAKFIKIPYLRPKFFELNLQLSSAPEGILTTDNGVSEVMIKHGAGPVALVHDLLYNESQSKQKLPPGVQLPRYCVIINDGDKVRFSMRFPFAGVYKLQVLDAEFEWLCSFKIICKTAKQLCEPFPEVSNIGFGPCRATLDAKLTAESHNEGVIKVIEKKEIEMMFSVPQTVSVKAVLNSAKIPGKALKDCVKQRVQFDSLTIKVTVPHRGDFCLKLLTKGKNPSDKYRVVCNYLLTTDEFNSKKKPRTTLKKHSHDVLALSSRTISELHRYKEPVPIMVDIMRATYLLLGENESTVAEWEDLQTLMRKTGRDSLSVRIRLFDVTKLKVPLAKKVLGILSQYDKETALGASAGAGTFYQWASGVAQDVISEESTTQTDNSSTPLDSPDTPQGKQRDTPHDTPRFTPIDTSRDQKQNTEENGVPITTRSDSVSPCLSLIAT